MESFERIDSLRRGLAEQRAELQGEVERLRSMLLSRRGLTEEQARPGAWPVDPERWHTLRLRVQARIAEFAERGGKGPQPARMVADNLLELFVKERAASLAELRRRTDGELSQLERRLARVDDLLVSADELLTRVRGLGQLDTGMASHARGDGRNGTASIDGHKAKALDELYRENLRLQDRDAPAG